MRVRLPYVAATLLGLMTLFACSRSDGPVAPAPSTRRSAPNPMAFAQPAPAKPATAPVTVAPSPQPSPPPALPPAPVVLRASDFGAVGDGAADDTRPLQKAINATTAGGTLELQSGAKYRITKGLNIDRPMTLKGNGAMLYFDVSPEPYKVHLTIYSNFPTPPVRFKQPLLKGQVAQVTLPPVKDSTGRYQFAYGQDPHDAHEKHFIDWADSQGRPPAAPWDITGDLHSYRYCPAPCHDVTVSDLSFDQADGAVVDTAIYVKDSRKVALSNLSGRFYIGVAAGNSDDVTLSGFRGRVEWLRGHNASGRVLTVSMGRNTVARDVDVSAVAEGPIFFAENWARGIRLESWRVRVSPQKDPKAPPLPVFFSTGGAADIYIGDVKIDAPGGVYLWDCGGDKSAVRPKFGRVDIGTSPVTAIYAPVEELIQQKKP